MADLVESLTDSLKKLGIDAAYGAPVEVDGKTIVPVALAWSGFGGGTGNASSPGTVTERIAAGDAGGEGFGGGGATIPIGAYVTEGGRAVFQPNIIALAVVSIPLIWTTGHALSRIIRALKK